MPRYCVKDECKTRASFNVEGETTPLYCANHKEDNMVDMTRKKCIHPNCKVIPTFNYENETKGLYCSTHKEVGMTNVVDKKCVHHNCKVRPNFNVEGKTTGLYCSKHQKVGMVNVKHKPCVFDGCKKQPSCNYENETKGLYCSKHRKDGMINVVSERCQFDECQTLATYNFQGLKKGIYCVIHKDDGMIDIKHKRCVFDGCQTRPNYNYENQTKPIFCNDHKKNGMIDVVKKQCRNEWCFTYPKNNKYDGYCFYCYINMFPEKPVARNYKTKEQSVVDFIKDNFPNVDWVADKRVDDGCSKRRPDLFLHMGNQILIIEVDENQHTDYNCSCENKRIMELSLDVGHIPIVFIRFNPDMYYKQKTKVSSCWGLNGYGILVIKNKDEWTERLSRLSDVVKYWLENITDKTIETIHLYYDE